MNNMVAVEGGTFTMGAQDKKRSSDEKPKHKVKLSSFYIGRYEVTQEEWLAVMGTNPSSLKGENKPVESVSWVDCQAFIQKLNTIIGGGKFRLPTEAEWEYAARGGNKSKGFDYAGGNYISNVAWYNGNYSSTYKIGAKDPNELGLYDMSGNVWEWCQDFYGNDYYSSSPQSNPYGPTYGTTRVCRGGSWSNNEGDCLVTKRYSCVPSKGYNNLGFRLAF